MVAPLPRDASGAILMFTARGLDVSVEGAGELAWETSSFFFPPRVLVRDPGAVSVTFVARPPEPMSAPAETVLVIRGG